MIALGKDTAGHTWCLTNNYRNIEVAQKYVDQFLKSSQKAMDFYINHLSKPMPKRYGHHTLYCQFQEVYTEEYARNRLLCIIAPCYFIKDLPKAVYAVSDKIVEVLSHKRKAPSFAQIKQFEEDLRIEMLLKYNL